jgi:hypothetical protein
VSFFDEGDEPRTTRRTRERPPARSGGRGPRPPRGPRRPSAAPDRQTLLIRQGVAGLVAILVLVLLVVGINSCRSSARDNALRDYNRNVGTIASESDEVGQQLFSTLTQQSLQPVDQQTQVNQLRVRAQQQAQRARNLDVPGDMEDAQSNLLLTLDLRADAVSKIASRIVAARGDQEGAAEQAVDQISGEMQAFLASDVIYAQRVVPFINEALADADIGGQRIVGARFMDDLTWLAPDTVAGRLGASAGGGGGANQQVAPGRHGHGLTSVSVGNTTLQPQPATNRVPATAGLAFTVKFSNQGDNEETDVRVRVRVRPQTGKAISVTKTVDQTNPGAESEVNIPLGQAPPTGTSSTVSVDVLRVPGEENVENNAQEYTVLFTR